jgi:hypothetical protein
MARMLNVVAVPGCKAPELDSIASSCASNVRGVGYNGVAQYRRCFVLLYVEGRSYDEIAKIVRLRVGTVKSHLHRATEHLRRMLEPEKETLRDGKRR